MTLPQKIDANSDGERKKKHTVRQIVDSVMPIFAQEEAKLLCEMHNISEYAVRLLNEAIADGRDEAFCRCRAITKMIGRTQKIIERTITSAASFKELKDAEEVIVNNEAYRVVITQSNKLEPRLKRELIDKIAQASGVGDSNL